MKLTKLNESKIFQVLFQSRLWLILVLGFSAGLPLGLTGTTLQAWYTVEQIDIVTIGMLALIGQPYVYKFLWAPFLDRFVLPFGKGRRRGWILFTQFGLILLLGLMSQLNPSEQPGLLALVALAVAVFSATQDIAIDAYRTEVLTPESRGIGAAMFVAGYRIAMLVSAGFAMVMANFYGFESTYLLMSALMLIGVVATLFSKEAPIQKALGSEKLIPLSIKRAFVDPLKEFFSRENAIGLISLIILYKLGDAFAGTLTTTFLIREVGFDLLDVGLTNKTTGLAGSLIGAFVGGLALSRMGLFKALLSFGILQAVSNLGFYILCFTGPDYGVMVSTVFIENFCGGMGTAAYLALIMSLCDIRYTATQFALLSALSAIGRVFVGPLAGLMVKEFGWADFFIASLLFSLPGLVLLFWFKHPINKFYQPSAS
jgi:PAT family beta-lactamase induction signal transducer AmpG